MRILNQSSQNGDHSRNAGSTEIDRKWAELIGFATQHAMGNGTQTGIKWLEDSFNEYLALSDATPGYGMGGQPGSEHNRQVLAQKVLLALGNDVGGRHQLDEDQAARLKDTLQTIAKNRNNSGLKV